jgi:hypothetical protein
MAKWLRFCLRAIVGLLAAGWSGATLAEAQTAVDLQLVLAVDASGSVSNERFLLQQRGYSAAFRSPHLLDAIRGGANRAIAVTMTQWTGTFQQIQVVPWGVVNDERSMHAFADAIDDAQRQLFGGGTSISGAIDHARILLSDTSFFGGRRVIDVSGDGANNRGRPAEDARDDAVNQGININGLPILALEPNLDDYYRNHVIGGPGSFMIVATSYESFAEAVLKKLIIEISADGTSSGPVSVASYEPE